MHGFESNLLGLLNVAAPSSIHEVGCGEGYWVFRCLEQGLEIRGSDFSDIVIELAKENARTRDLPEGVFSQCSVYDLKADKDAADLIICCEVLEHLDQPEKALEVLQEVTRKHIILSVPREPVWSVLNMVRGKYWSELGNTPGHIQRWSQGAFVDLVARYFNVVQVRSPLPWTMLLCTTLDHPAV